MGEESGLLVLLPWAFGGDGVWPGEESGLS
jgi:hypothetical protein